MKTIFYCLPIFVVICNLFISGCSEEEIKEEIKLPTLFTSEVSSITALTAVSGGIVTFDGGADIACGICWSTSAHPTVEDYKTTDFNGTGNFTGILTGLEPATKYYVRAYAKNSVGIAYGNEVSFTTTDDIIDKFTDPIFRAYCLVEFDSNSDGKLTVSEASVVEEIYVYNYNIGSLTGIEYFVALKKLYCSYNPLTTLDVSKNTKLAELSCVYNELTILDLSKNTELVTLWCSSNQLVTLDVSKNVELFYLNCLDNQLIRLDVSGNTKLTYLDCRSNRLTILDISKNTQLISLSCSNNQLSTLDIDNNLKLFHLDCSFNQFVTLNVKNNVELFHLYCNNNQLKTLDISNNANIKEFDCRDNPITTIWVWDGFNNFSSMYFNKPEDAVYEIKLSI